MNAKGTPLEDPTHSSVLDELTFKLMAGDAAHPLSWTGGGGNAVKVAHLQHNHIHLEKKHHRIFIATANPNFREHNKTAF